MYASFKFVALTTGVLALSCIAMAQTNHSTPATVQQVDVLNHGSNFELEIRTSQPITPRTQVVTGPDRLVIDFPNAVPGSRFHSIAVNAGHIKSVRMGLFESNPPVARVVIDLNSPQAYQVFPSGKSVIVKIAAGGITPAAFSPRAAPLQPAVALGAPPPPPVQAPPPPTFQVEFSQGKLTVRAERSTLGEVLHAIARQIGAKVSLPPGAEHEPVIANLGPAAPREVVSALLNGIPYNVVLLGSGSDLSQVTGIVITSRNGDTGSLPANYNPAPVQEAPPEAEPEPVSPPPPAEGQENAPPQDTVPPPPQ